MKKITYFIILSLVCTVAFSQAKPCCKKKGKEKVSCKLNKANIDINDKRNCEFYGCLITELEKNYKENEKNYP